MSSAHSDDDDDENTGSTMADDEYDDEEEEDEEDEQIRHSGKKQIQKYSVKNGRLFLEIDGGLPVIDLKADGTFVAQAKDDSDSSGAEVEVREGMDKLGRRLSHLGEALRVSTAKFKGRQMYEMYQREPETGARYAAWFDDEGTAYFLYFNDVLLMVKQVEAVLIKLGHLANPDLSDFGELESRPASQDEGWINAQAQRQH